MNAFMIYLLKSSVCLGIFFLFYWIFLRRDTFFRLNRFFLLSAGMLSMILPLLHFNMSMPLFSSSLTVLLDPVRVSPGIQQGAMTGRIGTVEIAGIIWFTGLVAAMSGFLVKLVQMIRIIQSSGSRKEKGFRLVLTDRFFSPFSFFNRIFINGRSIADETLERILEHERIHIKQVHSLDLIFSEFLIMVQWFNPAAWMFRHELKNIHEFLADEGAIGKGIPVTEYQQLVLNETMGIRVNSLANNFNISQLKNRMIMMTKKRSGSWSAGKALLALPLIIAMGLFLSAGTNSPSISQGKSRPEPVTPTTSAVAADTAARGSKTKASAITPDEQPSYPGGYQALIDFMLKNIKYPEAAKKEKAQGEVLVTFKVKPDGTVSDVKVIRGFRRDCDEEAVRVVKMMPKWNPGKYKGEPLEVILQLPVKFALDSKKPADTKK